LSRKKQKYIKAPTTDDLVRIEAGEKFSDITASPIKKAISGALSEDIDEIAELTAVAVQPVVKKRKTIRRQMYFSLGVLLIVMSIIGAIFTVNFCVDIFKKIADNTVQKNEFSQFIYPVVVVDTPTFEEVSQLPVEVILKAAVWDIIINQDKSKYENYYGSITIPASDVEVAATNLFGGGIPFVHQTLGDTELYFDYVPETNSYIVPISPHYLPYSPQVEDIKKLGDNKYELKVGYYPPVQAWLPEGTKAVPDKYMKYTVVKQSNKYNIISVGEGINPDQSPY